MSDLNLGPPKSPSSAPGFITAAVLLIAIAGGMAYRYTHHVAHLSIPRATVFPVHTDFASATIETKHAVEDDLYVLATLHIQNDNAIPVLLKSYNAVLLDSNGEQHETKALSAQDIPVVLTTFPKIRPLATPSLDLESTIAPGATAEGMVLLQFPITKDIWDKRKSATLTVGFYHQGPVTLAIP